MACGVYAWTVVYVLAASVAEVIARISSGVNYVSSMVLDLGCSMPPLPKTLILTENELAIESDVGATASRQGRFNTLFQR